MVALVLLLAYLIWELPESFSQPMTKEELLEEYEEGKQWEVEELAEHCRPI